MNGVYDSYLVALSVAIAILSSFTALNLAGRVRASSGKALRVWLAASAMALGGGIWSMHFVAMLAFSMPGAPMRYDTLLTLISLAIAVAFTGAGLALVDWRQPSWRRTLASGSLIGTGVAAMHYLGMAAMKVPATVSYDAAWVVLSIAIAVTAATAAVWLAGREHGSIGRVLASVVMGAAIAGMHYTGMYAAIFAPATSIDDARGLAGFDQTNLAMAISLVTITVLMLGLAAARVERVLRRSATREAHHRFLSRLNDKLFDAPDAWQAMAAATELLGVELGASRCAYADVEDDGDRFWIRSDFTAPGLQSSVGEYSLALFGPRAVAELQAGKCLVVRDVERELAADEGGATFRSIAITAIICCPLVSNGRLSAMMAVHQDHPRDWTRDEIALVSDTVERCWAHVGRVGTEVRLRESEERLRLAVENAEVGFWDVDLVKDQLIWPPTTKAMFGIGPHVHVTLQDFYDGLHPDDHAATAAAFAAAADPERRALYDVEYRTIGREDGLVRWVAAKGRGTFDDQGRCIRVAGTAVEITQRKEAEQALQELNATLEARIAEAISDREEAEAALRQSQKMESIGQLTGGVAHDFNNLLTPIIGSLDLLQRKAIGGEREQRLIAAAAQSAERARVLVQRLLAFARRQPLRTETVDVGRLITGMAELISGTTGPKIHVVTDLPADLPTALADPNQLEMAILNLALNARDAMPDGGRLTVTACGSDIGAEHRSGLIPGPYLCLAVMDTGTGMDEATLARAAEPFFSTKGIGEGTGLGLSMVHGLASQLGGALTMESKPGVGTTMRLWLPVSVAPLSTSHRGDTRSTSLKGGTVLVVDDEDLVRMTTASMLTEFGYCVTEAASAEEAMRLVDGGAQFDLLITDQLMPGMTGTDLAHHIRAQRPTQSVLIISGFTKTEGIDVSLPRLGKPFRRDEMVAALREVEGGRVSSEQVARSR